MGRIEEALTRAGVPGPAAGVAGADGRRHAQLAATGEDYPREHLDEYTRDGLDRDSDRRSRERMTPERPVRPLGVRSAPAWPTRSATPPRVTTAHGVPRFDESVHGKLVTDGATASSSREQYRRLAATLHQMQAERGFKTLMVSSAVPREGKTLTSVNIALTLSESYKNRVLLVDADLRRPSIHAVLGLPNTSGLGEALRSEHAALQLIEVSQYLKVLPAGRPDRDPIAGLTSERMRALLAEAAEQFDWVIVDTPPVGLISDARLLADLADGVLLVTSAGSTDYQLVQRAVEELGRDRIIGAVLNRADPDTIAPAEYYDYYYGGASDDRHS